MQIPARGRRPWKQPRASSNRWAIQQTPRFTVKLLNITLLHIFSCCAHIYVCNVYFTQIQVLPDGGETPMFKQFFKGWKEKDQTEGLGRVYVTERIAKIQQVQFDASKLHESNQMAAQYNMVDNGSGQTQVTICIHTYIWCELWHLSVKTTNNKFKLLKSGCQNKFPAKYLADRKLWTF